MTSPKAKTNTGLAPADVMRMAIRLSRRALGASAENPPVGCVLARPSAEGYQILARGWTQAGGRPHAEGEALARAGGAAKGAEVYITLEPCAHHGQTPPCANALIEAGVARVAIALSDPDSRVNGKGIAMLREAGIEVETGLLAQEAHEVLEPYLTRQREGRPFITLKLATSLDGKIAAASGESQWITGKPARRFAHLLRAESDAVMVGAQTARQDDPSLTCRLAGLESRSPMRIIADARLSLSLTSDLVRSAKDYPLLVLTGKEASPERAEALRQCGVELAEVALDEAGLIDMPAALRELAGRGVASLLVEGGSRLAASLIEAGMVDRLVWFMAPIMLGARGFPAIAGLSGERLADAPRFAFSHPPLQLGEDRVLFARIRHDAKAGEVV